MSYQMRTSCPSNNKYYIRQVSGGWNGAIQGKPTKSGANVLANCVGYANGRYAEVIGKNKVEYQLVCNAENFIEKAKDYGLKVVSYPTLGGIMVWQKGTLSASDGAGHVAIVERIDNNNQIYTSESAYASTAFYNATRTNNNGRWGMSSKYKFRGCIVNPAIGDARSLGKVAEFQQTLNTRYNLSISVDNVAGNTTKWANVTGLQIELNKQYNKDLTVDGVFGSKTNNACITLEKGSKGNIVYLMQGRLLCLGYNINVDGVFGDATLKVVKQFQKDKKIGIDGVVGKTTWNKLFA